jgi:hypothetical protein
MSGVIGFLCGFARKYGHGQVAGAVHSIFYLKNFRRLYFLIAGSCKDYFIFYLVLHIDIYNFPRANCAGSDAACVLAGNIYPVSKSIVIGGAHFTKVYTYTHPVVIELK